MSTDPPIAPPSQSLVAGKYQLSTLIGRGGMGSVWEGRHVSLGTRVAVKFIEKEYADSPEARQRFQTEARAAATIQSKFAVQIFDHGVTDDGRPYIVMELLEGEGLDKRLERLGRIPLQEVASHFLQVCRALQRAHDGGIIHRDLKPENIFVQRSHDDDEEIAKVLDFGIAKIRAVDGTTLSSSTKTGAVLGTPFYMSPEQARGLREIDHRTDLWSLGVIAFRCVAGVLPFDGQSLGDLLVKICTAPLPVPSHVVPGLPPAFDAWIARALDRDPAQRFQTANELADGLAFAAGLSVKRSPGSLPRPSAQTPLPSGTLPSGGVAATPGAAASTPAFGATSAPLTATSPGAIKRSGAGAVIGIAAAMLLLGGGGATWWFLSHRAPPLASTPTAASASEHAAATAPAASSAAPAPTLVVDSIAPMPSATVATTNATPKPTSNGRSGHTGKTTPPPLPKPDTTKTEAKVEPKPVDTKSKPGPTTANPGF